MRRGRRPWHGWLMGALVRARETSRRYQGGGLRAPGRLPAAVVLAVVLIGATERWWVAAHPIGTLTSDGAVIGLMALHCSITGSSPRTCGASPTAAASRRS